MNHLTIFISFYFISMASAIAIKESYLFAYMGQQRRARSASESNTDSANDPPDSQEQKSSKTESTEEQEESSVSKDDMQGISSRTGAAESPLTSNELAELEQLDHGHDYDQEHYYRIPGGKCNTTEQIKERWAKVKGDGLRARLRRHDIERRKCLWYTKTHCSPVAVGGNQDRMEYRCICIEGRTWEDGACLAYHGQKCLWDNDCVRGANCKLPGDEGYPGDTNGTKTNGQKSRKRKRRRRQAVTTAMTTTAASASTIETSTKDLLDLTDIGISNADKDNMIRFEFGICVCRMFAECQRTGKFPPFIDESDLGFVHQPSSRLLVLVVMTVKLLI